MAPQAFPSLNDGQDLLHDLYAGIQMGPRGLKAVRSRVLWAGDKVQASHPLFDIETFDMIALTETHFELKHEYKRRRTAPSWKLMHSDAMALVSQIRRTGKTEIWTGRGIT